MDEFEILKSWIVTIKTGFINHMHVGVAWTVLIFFFVSFCKLINFYLKSKLINFILTVESPPRFYTTCISISRATRETRFPLKSFFFFFECFSSLNLGFRFIFLLFGDRDLGERVSFIGGSCAFGFGILDRIRTSFSFRKVLSFFYFFGSEKYLPI